MEKDSNQSTAFGLTWEGSKNYYHEYMLHSKLIIHSLIHILFTASMSLLICTSSWFHSDVLGAVKHINELYEQVASILGSESTSTRPQKNLSLCARWDYLTLEELSITNCGQYKVLLWADFFSEDQEQKKYKRGISLRNTNSEEIINL